MSESTVAGAGFASVHSLDYLRSATAERLVGQRGEEMNCEVAEVELLAKRRSWRVVRSSVTTITRMVSSGCCPTCAKRVGVARHF